MFSPRCDYSILRFPRDVLISDVGASRRHSTRRGLGESRVATSSNEVWSRKYQSLDNSTYLFIERKASCWALPPLVPQVLPIFGQSSHKAWQVVIASKHWWVEAFIFLTVLILHSKSQVVQTGRSKWSWSWYGAGQRPPNSLSRIYHVTWRKYDPTETVTGMYECTWSTDTST